jgi:hypothetical protein
MLEVAAKNAGIDAVLDAISSADELKARADALCAKFSLSGG